MSCYVGLSCSYIVLYRHFFRYYNDTMVLLQLKVFIPTPVSHNIYLRSQPTQSTPLFGTTQMTQSVSSTHDTSSTYISSFSQCTKLKVSLTTQVTRPTYLYHTRHNPHMPSVPTQMTQSVS